MDSLGDNDKDNPFPPCFNCGMGFEERFPAQRELRSELIAVSKELEKLKGATIVDTEIDQDACVTIKLQDGRSFAFELKRDEDFLSVIPFHVDP